jgi:ribonuclease III
LKLIPTGFFSKNTELSEAIKNIFGFRPENIFLYDLAFRHKSASIERTKGIKYNNERLEYLGDAILSAVVADFLFKKYPNRNEGFLTEIRSRIVSREHLNTLAVKLGLPKLIKFSFDQNVYRSINGDTFEAFIGALYVDKGYKFTKRIVINRILKYHVDVDEIVNNDQNFKSRLIEWAQKEKKQLEFIVVNKTGVGFKKQYEVEVVIDRIPIARGMDFSIKKAEQNAAAKAFEALSNTIYQEE